VAALSRSLEEMGAEALSSRLDEAVPQGPDLLILAASTPQQMMGALIKTHWAQREGVDSSRIFSVSIMPCVAKKFEAGRPELSRNGHPDVDAVLTTRELARLIKMRGISLAELIPGLPDSPLGERTTAGKIFGATGGVMEAALRTAFFLITGTDLAELRFQQLRGMRGIKEATVEIAGIPVGVAVASSLANARSLLGQLQAGRDDLHFIEVMTCPGGCISGGGQPLGVDLGKVQARMRALYAIDRKEQVRTSHANQEVAQLYREFLGEPLGERSHELLHTHHVPREVLT
jgi:NADH-quinone oxidoreductase subunit G/NADP-reducing hydrogenase subunit HndD